MDTNCTGVDVGFAPGRAREGCRPRDELIGHVRQPHDGQRNQAGHEQRLWQQQSAEHPWPKQRPGHSDPEQCERSGGPGADRPAASSAPIRVRRPSRTLSARPKPTLPAASQYGAGGNGHGWHGRQWMWHGRHGWNGWAATRRDGRLRSGMNGNNPTTAPLGADHLDLGIRAGRGRSRRRSVRRLRNT